MNVNTKVKYYDDYISDQAPKKTHFSSRLMKKELGVDWSAHKLLQMEVPDATEEDQKVSTPESSSSLSQGNEGSDASSVKNASPQGSDAASVCQMTETSAGTSMVEFGGGQEPSCDGVAMEQLVLHVQAIMEELIQRSVTVCRGPMVCMYRKKMQFLA